MKKITLLFCLLAVTFGYSQQVVLEDFEGTAPSTDLFDGFTSATVVANPTNASEQSLELITNAAGQAWQGAKLIIQNTTIDMTTADKTMTVDIYSTTPRDFLFKLVDGVVGGTDANQESKTAAVHTGNGWETLTLDFNIGADTGQPGYNPPNDKFGGIVFFPLYIAPNDGWVTPAMTTTYIDNVTAISGGVVESCNDGILNNGETEIDCGGPNCSACPNPPAAAPTTPPNRAAADVISVYSNAYTTAPTDGFQTFGGAVVSEIDYSGNTIQAVTTPDNGSGLQYQYFGVSPQFLDLSLMSNMHIDFYFEGTITDVDTVILVIAQYSDGTNIQKTFNLNTLAAGTWHEMDFAFADFNLNATNARDEIQQVIVQVAGPNGSQVGPLYFDNLYFHNNQVLSTESFETTEFRAYPNPTSGNWNISGKSIITSVAVYDILGKQVINIVPNTNEAAIDASSLNSGIYFARIDGVNGSKTIKLIKE